eukprot:9270612-Alexandrium_andersonii.AAC.1
MELPRCAARRLGPCCGGRSPPLLGCAGRPAPGSSCTAPFTSGLLRPLRPGRKSWVALHRQLCASSGMPTVPRLSLIHI